MDKFVSRGGIKLQAALEKFKLDVTGGAGNQEYLLLLKS